MIVDDNDSRPPPEYSEGPSTQKTSGKGSEGATGPGPSVASALPRHVRQRSVLYESDMEDPFSNPPTAAGPSRERPLSDGFFGNGTNVLPSPNSPVSGYYDGPPSTLALFASGSGRGGSRLRPTSGQGYSDPQTGKLASYHTATGSQGGGGHTDGNLSDSRSTYYSEYEQNPTFHSNASMNDLGDLSPLVNRNMRSDHSTAHLMMNGEDSARGMQPLEYQDPYGNGPYSPGVTPPANDAKQGGFFEKMFGDTSLRHPLEQRIENRRRGVTRQSRPYISWALAAVMAGVLIYELVYNATQQGPPISLKPYVNYMLGPSQVGLISLGARWPACMRIVPSIPLTLTIGCPSNVDNPPTKLCSIEQICAHGGFHNATPNQWWRFITPIFLHAGIIHYVFNMFAQLTVSAQVEREIGSIGFFILYFTAGIFGNILGGNFALVGLPSVGASGAIFGTVGVLWVDLLAHWGIETQPGKKLAMLCVDLVVGVALGYIPGVDNFVHLGGFLAGLICAAIFLPVISTTRLHKSVMWGVRICMIPLIIVLYVVLLRNFYTTNPFAACNWCRYLSCIPTSSNNKCQGTGLSITTTTT